MAKKKDNRNLFMGLLLIAIGIGLFIFRPLSECSFFNIFCHTANLVSTIIFFVVMIILLLVGTLTILRIRPITQMFFVFLTLLVIDLIIPDPLPLLDELVLMFATVITGALSRRKGGKS